MSRIAQRVEIDRVRSSRGRQKKPSRRDHDPASDGFAAEATPGAITSIEPEREATELRAHIVRGLTCVLAVFDSDERAVLVRRFARGESADVIARGTGSSRRSTARHLRALLDELRDLLIQVRVSEQDVRYVLARCRHRRRPAR
jgi:DNA-directed RNA polymerase specialized sigma24 family protein